MRGGCQVIDVVALALGLGRELVDQRRHQLDHIGDHLLHQLVGLDAAIQHAVEHVLDRPGQLADDQRADHAATALEGVEGAPHFGQRFLVVGVGTPLRQVFVDGLEDLTGLLDEHFEQILVHRLFVDGRRQQGRRDVLGRRVDGLHGRSHHLSHGQRPLDRHRSRLRLDRGTRQLDFRQFEIGNLQLVPVARRAVEVQFLGRFFTQAWQLLAEQKLGRFAGLARLGAERLQIIQAGQLERCVEAQVQAGSAVFNGLAQAPVVVGDQQFAGIDRQLGKFAAQLVARQRRQLFQRQRLLFGQRLEGDFLGSQHLDVLQRVDQRCRCFLARLDAIEDRGLLLERVAQAFQAFLGDVEDQVALSRVVFGQTLQVVLDAGDGVGQGVEVLPVGHGLAHQQLLFDIAGAGLQQVGGAGQRNHRQATADLGQQLRHTGQVLMVPLRGDELDDRVLGLLQAGTRLLDHQLVNLRHVGGGQVALFVLRIVAGADHAGQGGLDIQQRTGHIHQHRVVRLTLAEGQGMYHVDLVEDHLARLAKAEHRQGIGDLLERRQQGIQLGHLLAVAAHEQVEAVLDPHQLLAQGAHHRTHGVAVGTGQARALFVDHAAVGQGVVEAVLFLEGADARRLRRRLGHIEQQVLGQFVRSGLVDAVGALVDQALELLVHLAQQGTHRSTVDHAAIGQALDHAGSDLPQRAERRLLAQGLETSEDARHVAQVGGQVLAADHADQGHLQHLPQLAQQHRQFGGAQFVQGVQRQCRQAAGQVRGEQAGFRQQVLAARGAQIVEQWQHDHRQVATRTLDAVKVGRQLQDGLHQHFQGLVLIADAAIQKSLGQLLHFFGEQGRAVELDHLQSAVDLVHVGLAETHARGILRVLDERLQGLAGLLQGLRDFAFDPLQGDIVVPITHTCSSHSCLSPCG